MRTIHPSESQEQATLFKWAELESRRFPELALMFAIPNGAHKSMAQAMKFKREGLKKGVPDIFLPAPVGVFHGLFIEMKRVKGGVWSEEQKQWAKDLCNAGYSYAICHGWKQAADCIVGYLKGEIG